MLSLTTISRQCMVSGTRMCPKWFILNPHWVTCEQVIICYKLFGNLALSSKKDYLPGDLKALNHTAINYRSLKSIKLKHRTMFVVLTNERNCFDKCYIWTFKTRSRSPVNLSKALRSMWMHVILQKSLCGYYSEHAL